MRLRSQDKTVDIPYELCAIQVKKSVRENDEENYLIKAKMGGDTFNMATYSKQASAIKALDEVTARFKNKDAAYTLPDEDNV